jgi:hypothetical protein
MRLYYLQAIDAPSGFVVAEVSCGPISRETLNNIIQPKAGDPTFIETYKLSNEQAASISKLCGVAFTPGSNEILLCSWDEHDDLPYRSHAPRELLLVLDGTKPLVFLNGTIPSQESLVEIPEYLFDPFVERGILMKREYCLVLRPYGAPEGQAFPVKGVRYVLYARCDEAWRMDAFIIIHNTAAKIGWNEALYRMEGFLLGYEEWQNDAFIARMADHARKKDAQ